MSTKTTVGKAGHIRHSDEYKQESLKLAAQIGVAKAAKNWVYTHHNSIPGASKQNMPNRSVSVKPAWPQKMPD